LFTKYEIHNFVVPVVVVVGVVVVVVHILIKQILRSV
jgi:hypothetical protein